MSEKNIEIMKKIIEEKKKKSAEQGIVSKNGFNDAYSRKPFGKNKKGK